MLAYVLPPPFEKAQVKHLADVRFKVLADFFREDPKLHFILPIGLLSGGKKFEILCQSAIVDPPVVTLDRLHTRFAVAV